MSGFLNGCSLVIMMSDDGMPSLETGAASGIILMKCFSIILISTTGMVHL